MKTNNPFGRSGWTPDRLPDLNGKQVVITGANSGIGFEAALILAARGAKQIWLCRNVQKANDAAGQVRAKYSTGSIDIVQMDLSDLETVKTAAATVRDKTDRIDALINNAGIMMIPDRQQTAKGSEKQLGVNHVGHFVLNALLADLVEAAEGRFVAVASGAHRFGAMDFDDLMWERTKYTPIAAYGRSKLANILYIKELDRRLKAAGRTSIAVGCHPGYSATNLQSTGPGAVWTAVMKVSNLLMAQRAEYGAWPTLLAAFDPDAERDGYYGPTGFNETRGAVGVAGRSSAARSDSDARSLWDASLELTGVDWGGI